MIDNASRGDLEGFKRLFFESDDFELMYWHVTKAFKEALKQKHLNLIAFMIVDLKLSLNHETFDKVLHLFLFGCQEAEIENDEEGMELNR